MDYKNMTNEEIIALRKRRWKEANESGAIEMLLLIGRKLGVEQNQSYGPKYRFTHGDFMLYIDDYGHTYFAVYMGQRVISKTEEFFIPGEWVNEVMAFYKDAYEIHEAETQARAEHYRNNLLDQVR